MTSTSQNFGEASYIHSILYRHGNRDGTAQDIVAIATHLEGTLNKVLVQADNTIFVAVRVRFR